MIMESKTLFDETPVIKWKTLDQISAESDVSAVTLRKRLKDRYEKCNLKLGTAKQQRLCGKRKYTMNVYSPLAERILLKKDRGLTDDDKIITFKVQYYPDEKYFNIFGNLKPAKQISDESPGPEAYKKPRFKPTELKKQDEPISLITILIALSLTLSIFSAIGICMLAYKISV